MYPTELFPADDERTWLLADEDESGVEGRDVPVGESVVDTVVDELIRTSLQLELVTRTKNVVTAFNAAHRGERKVH